MIRKKQLEKQRELLLKEREEELLEEVSLIPLVPQEILEREAKIAGEEIKLEPTPLQPPQISSRKRITKIKDTPTLLKFFKEALEKDDEGLLAHTLKALEFNGEDVIFLLRQQILENFAKPEIRRLAVFGLFYVDNVVEAISILKTILKVDPEEKVRLAALLVLEGLLGGENLAFFEEISRQDPSEKVRLRAQRCIISKSIYR